VTGARPGQAPPAWCEHGRGHDGGVPSAATAPAGARAWLLIEFDGPWAAEATATELRVPLAKLAIGAEELGVRVQLIRRARPSRRDGGGRAGRGAGRPQAVFAGWTAGPRPWVRRMSADGLDQAALTALAAGALPGGTPEPGPLFLVCTHGRRDRCCARLGVPLARDLAARYPDEVWETTHVGGHRFAANLVILPHGLYYGPVGEAESMAAIDAYQRGRVTAGRYRGRAGQPRPTQEAEHEALVQAGSLAIAALA
jgi:hypothetical protein